MTATGVAAAASVGALAVAAVAVSQATGGKATPQRAVLTAATLRHLAGASQAAMTSGRADIDWAGSGSARVSQQIAFGGGNWNDVIHQSGFSPARHTPRGVGALTSVWTGKSVSRAVDGQQYHYPAIACQPRPHFAAGWMRVTVPGGAGALDIPDPRTLLQVLSPSAGFVRDGFTNVNGVRLEHLYATTPGAVPVKPLDPIIQSEPSSPRLSALDLWTDPSGVVIKARMAVTGAGARHTVTVTVTFSQIGQPQMITAPAHVTTGRCQG
jgi:hypothetical protein